MAAGDAFVYSSAGYLTSGHVSTGPISLYTANGFNPSADALFIQFFQSAALPVDGATPAQSIAVGAGQEWSWTPNQPGRNFFLGCWFVVSTTGDTLTTAGSGMWVEVEGRQV